MPSKIQLMIVDDNQLTRNNLKKLIELEDDLQVSCEASSGEEAIQKASLMLPDIILMDINMPGMDGLAATEIISNNVPDSTIIVISVQGEQEYLRRAMAAGAKDYLIKPFDGDELVDGIRHIFTRERKRREKLTLNPTHSPLGQVITIYSTKGGSGKTTIAANLGFGLSLDLRKKICIVDMNFLLGNLPFHLNVTPQNTISDLVSHIDNLSVSLLDSYLTRVTDNVKVLAAPPTPEQARTLTIEHITSIIKVLQLNYDYIVIDTPSALSPIQYHTFNLSTVIFLICSLDIPTLINSKKYLERLESFKDLSSKIHLVLNHSDPFGNITLQDATTLLKKDFSYSLSNDEITIVTAANQGIPFVMSTPQAVVSTEIMQIVDHLNGKNRQEAIPTSKQVESPPEIPIQKQSSTFTKLRQAFRKTFD